MNLRKARKIWWNTGRWGRYRLDVLDRAHRRFLRSMGLSERQTAPATGEE